MQRSSGAHHHLAAWKTSGLSISAYCRKCGISRQSFYQWRHQAKQKMVSRPLTPPSEQSFTEIRFPFKQVDPSYKIRFGQGTHLEIPAGFNRAEALSLIASVYAVERGKFKC
jgi:hypothetical protein